jgi:hypothetical protein
MHTGVAMLLTASLADAPPKRLVTVVWCGLVLGVGGEVALGPDFGPRRRRDVGPEGGSMCL